MPFRLVFMGTPDFAVIVLDALVAAGHDVAAVYTQPPRPAGRGHRARPSVVQAFAEAHRLPVHAPPSLKAAGEQAAFAGHECDVAVVAAYGLILPQSVLSAPRLGCINAHASLLPRWRGAAPIERAIMAGDNETGVTIMQMEAGLDSGPILAAGVFPIGPDATAGDLHDGLAALAAGMVIEVLDGAARGTLRPHPQPAEGVTYAARIGPADRRLDWRRPAQELERTVRAVAPRPGAWFEHDGTRIKVLAARLAGAAGDGHPGTVGDGGLTIACGAGALELVRLQRPGRGAMEAADFLRGYGLPPGTRLA